MTQKNKIAPRWKPLALAAGLLAGTLAAGEAKWQPLFNGKDLSGWVVMHQAVFKVVGGNLRLVTGMGWLRTRKKYRDFILELEWRALARRYDSGIFIRAGTEGKPWPPKAWQINLRYNALGGLVKGAWPVVPAECPMTPTNKWVKFRIEVRGKQVNLDVDGKRSWSFNRLDAAEGYIGIQAENKPFDFRNIRIKPLD
ncbi:MAG: DUF1080 domain-containing protein [Verrucomicrobia bacterium]|nr:DUF1080 domain-containing protein [Verrucomicrobiota bacterium]